MKSRYKFPAFRQTGKFLTIGLIVFIAIILQAQIVTAKTTQISSTMLTCELETLPIADEITLAFNIKNPSDHPINVQYFQPFIDFHLSVYADDEQVPIIQPAYDTGLQSIATIITAGEIMRIETPIRLKFDPNVVPSGGNVATIWTLRHAPTAVLLRAEVLLSGATVDICETHFNPRKSL